MHASGFLTDNANSHLIYGYSAGIGVDMMLMCGPVHARRMGISFASPPTVDTNVNTVRVGLGYKF